MRIVVIGGTGLIGSKLVHTLTEHGHDAIAAAPSTGVNSPTLDDAAIEFFRTATTNLLTAEKDAGVGHHVALSVVGTDQLAKQSGYFDGKLLQEKLIDDGPIPYTIVHAGAGRAGSPQMSSNSSQTERRAIGSVAINFATGGQMSESKALSTAEQDVELTPDGIMQLGLAFWGSKTLLSAVELKLFGALSEAGPLDAEELRERLGLHPRSARDFFDALVALGMLDRTDGRYSNSPETDLFLDPAKPTYMGGILEMANARLYTFWGSLTEGLRTGQPQSEVKTGGEFFETLYANPEKLAQFTAAMSGLSRATGNAIAAKFPWRDYGSVIDIGCAQGAISVAIATAHDHLTGGGFDLPPVEPIFNSYVARFGLSDRLCFTPGNFFADPLPSADVLIMGHILHDWDLDQKRLLLQKAYDALPKGGALIVYEAIIDDDRRVNAFGLLMSLNMLIEGTGFDYTGADCRGWMGEAGFSESYVEHLVGPDSMVVGIK